MFKNVVFKPRYNWVPGFYGVYMKGVIWTLDDVIDELRSAGSRSLYDLQSARERISDLVTTADTVVRAAEKGVVPTGMVIEMSSALDNLESS